MERKDRYFLFIMHDYFFDEIKFQIMISNLFKKVKMYVITKLLRFDP